MKTFLVIASIATLASGVIGGNYAQQSGFNFNSNNNNGGQYPRVQNHGGLFGSSGAQAQANAGGYFGRQQSASIQPSYQNSGNNVGKIRKFVSVHVGQDEPASQQKRIIRAGGPQDTHYNIIFVKAPNYGSAQETEVILPEAPKQKTIVYVLTRRPQAGGDVQIRGPPPTQPAKPEVFFIRYKNDEGQGPVDNVGYPDQAAPIAPVGVNNLPLDNRQPLPGGLSSSYGAPPVTGHGPY